MAVLIALTFLTGFKFASAEVHGKFKSWYPYYGGVMELILRGKCIPGVCQPAINCSAELEAYLITNTGVHATDKCYNVFDCLSTGLLPNEASNFSNAGVLLGLTPALLSSLAPTLGEIALLSTKRKIFATLIALANPVISIPRYLSYTDPLDSLKPTPTMFIDTLLTLDGWKADLAAAVQYTLALAAVANVFQTSLQLGYQTVVSWKCNASYLPFLWSILPVAIHMLAAIGWHFSNVRKQLRKSGSDRSLTPWRTLARFMREEITLTSNASLLKLLEMSQHKSSLENKTSVFLNELAGFLSFLQILFGTVLFSSLMFIATLDALGVIARYVASGLVCWFLVTWELAAMRSREAEDMTAPPCDEIQLLNRRHQVFSYAI